MPGQAAAEPIRTEAPRRPRAPRPTLQPGRIPGVKNDFGQRPPAEETHSRLGRFSPVDPHVVGAKRRRAGESTGSILEHALSNGFRQLSVSKKAETAWGEIVVQQAENMVDFQIACASSYYNAEGEPGRTSRRSGSVFGGATGFAEMLEARERTGL